MIFQSVEFDNFLKSLAATRKQVAEIMSAAAGVDELSEATMLLMFQSFYNVLLTVKEPKDRMEFSKDLKELISALNTRRDIDRKAHATSERSAREPLDKNSLADIEQKLKLL